MIRIVADLWAFRELGIVLAWREIVVRYKRSVLGIFWALGEPLVMIAVYVAVFGVFLDVGGDAVENYAVFAMFGVLAWTFFSTTLERCSTTFLDYTPFYKKAYFPRELLVVAVLVSRLTSLIAGLALGLGAVAIVPVWRESVVWVRLPWFLVGILGLSVMCFGLGVFLAGLNALFRDTSFITRFGLRLAFYACPVVYPLGRVSTDVQRWLELNPLVALLWTFQGFADARVGEPSAASVISAVAACLVCGIGGWWAFRRVQWRVADVL
jgi:ABC-type polysaccharide/polyol phosphate export permease